MRELTAREQSLLGTLHLSHKCEQEVKKVWIEREYKQQREYANLLLFMIPFFVMVLIATSTYEYLESMKLFHGRNCLDSIFCYSCLFHIKNLL